MNFSPETEARDTFILLINHGLVMRWHSMEKIYISETSAME